MNSNDIAIQPGLLFGQLAYMLGGLLLVMMGAALLYTIAYWRLRAQRLDGVITGVQRRGPYFHSVYRYVLADGNVREAISVQGSGSSEGRTTGKHVEILVMSDKPQEARERRAPVTWTLGIGLLLGGGWLTYDAATAWPHRWFTWLVLAAVAWFVGRKLWRWMMRQLTALRPQADSYAAWSNAPVESAETLKHVAAPPPVQMTSATGSRRAGVIFSLAGVVVLAVACIPAHRLLQLRSGVRADGIVKQLHSNSSNKDRYALFPVVEFAGADGTVMSFLDRTGSNPSPYKVGDHVTVLYQPGLPDTAMIDRRLHNWEPVGASAVLGLILLCVGWLSLRGGSTRVRFVRG